jgi:DUF218 domain
MFGYDEVIIKNAQIVWDYMLLGHDVVPCDVMLILGNRDIRTAEWGAELYARGMADRIIVSGGVSPKNDLLDAAAWSSEADYFADVLLDHGVSDAKILRERTARNTGENVLYSYELLRSSGLLPKSLLLVQKPYMERRTYATFMKQWPGAFNLERLVVSSPPITLSDYCRDKEDFDETLSIMVGDLRRIELYPAKNFQIAQKVPLQVHRAANLLSRYGFNTYDIQQ